MQASIDNLKCQNCKKLYNLGKNTPYLAPCCQWHKCYECIQLVHKFCTHCPSTKQLECKPDKAKQQMLQSKANGTLFICQGCKHSTIQRYCGKHYHFLCNTCIISKCIDHHSEWEEVKREHIYKYAVAIQKMPKSIFNQGFKSIAEQILDMKTILVDEDFSTFIQTLKKLQDWESKAMNEQVVSPQDKEYDIKQLVVKLDSLLRQAKVPSLQEILQSWQKHTLLFSLLPMAQMRLVHFIQEQVMQLVQVSME
ncbi:hypothetical protein FGO68_gene12783 [Halteria grandinella]|uniref:Uncharacterized protein n=1 Tax=Halteria grandinella TaxID=5974 RepID=A0A8J8T6W4_HALGN|nr:hypothetical protein FGO68_gene12783 [Halteria grandinella]